MFLSRFWISMSSIHDNLDDARVKKQLKGISQEAVQFYLKYEVCDIVGGFLISDMWDIWRVLILSRRWSHWWYCFLCGYCRVGRQNKEVSILKLHWHGELGFSHIWHWSYLLVFFQQGSICESWREDVPKKSQRHSKKPWDLWIWYCRIFCQEWKWAYDCALGSGIFFVLGYQRICESFTHKKFANQKYTRLSS